MSSSTSLCQRLRERERALEEKMQPLQSAEARYQWIMEQGRQMPQLPKEEWTPEFRVQGCQSEMYLKVTLVDGGLHMIVGSDALISAGLAALLLELYEGLNPEEVIRCPLEVFKRLGLGEQLSPGRAQGLQALYRTMYSRAGAYIP